MKNILTGWVTTILGLVIMVFTCLDYFNIIQVQAPEGISKIQQLIGGFVVGFAMFLLPKTYFEKGLKTILTKKIKKN